jgi:hypothetical protein
MLGIDALTRGKIRLTKDDYGARCRKDDKRTPNAFAGRLLMAFRDALREVMNAHKTISVAQLSDSAFLWSEDLEGLSNAVRAMMWACIRRHLFCRAGLAYGEIVQPDSTHIQLGQFVLGAAATHAVALERSGKGCRIFTEPEFVSRLQHNAPYAVEPFQPLLNPLDGTSVDEFKWYLSTADLAGDPTGADALANAVADVWYSPMYAWNSANNEGRIHVAVTLHSLSQALSDRAAPRNLTVGVDEFLAAPPKRSDAAARNAAKRLATVRGDVAPL